MDPDTKRNLDIVLWGAAAPTAAYFLITRIFDMHGEGKEALATLLSFVGLSILVKRHG
jgi:hypothetical protein